MSWEDYLKKTTDEDITDWEVALKAFTEKGKELGIPLSVIELLKEASEKDDRVVVSGSAPDKDVIEKPEFSEIDEQRFRNNG